MENRIYTKDEAKIIVEKLAHYSFSNYDVPDPQTPEYRETIKEICALQDIIMRKLGYELVNKLDELYSLQLCLQIEQAYIAGYKNSIGIK